MSTQAFHHIHLWNPLSSCPFFSPSPLPPSCCSLPISPFSLPPPPTHFPSPLHSRPLPEILPILISPSLSLHPRCPPFPSPTPVAPHPHRSLLPVHPPLDYYTHLQLHLKEEEKLPAPQSRHATTIIEFLLIYSSKMTFKANSTQPTFIIWWFYIYPPNFSPLGLVVWPPIAEQIDR